MAKVKQPLLSLDARRKLGDDVVFARRRGVTIVERLPHPQDARSVGQLSWRHMFQKVVALWHALSAAEKEAWESLARRRHMTGYAWFVSQALRPNPGIYLPLQGGTMTGELDMGSQPLTNLPVPVDDSDAARKDTIAPGSLVVWKDVSTLAIDRTAPITWTDLDLTAHTSATAKFALIQLNLYVTVSGTGGNTTLQARKNGTAPTYAPGVDIRATAPNETWFSNFVIVGLDTGQVIEYRLKRADNATVGFGQLQILGYIE